MGKSKGHWTMVNGTMKFIPDTPVKKAPVKKKAAPVKEKKVARVRTQPDFSEIHANARKQSRSLERATAADMAMSPSTPATVATPSRQTPAAQGQTSSYIPKGGGGAGSVFKSLLNRSAAARKANKKRKAKT